MSAHMSTRFTMRRPCRSWSGYSLASHRGGLGSHPGSTWDLWWTKRHWGRFSPSTSVSPANHHSTNFSITIITRDWHNRPIGGRSAEWTQLDSTPPLYQLKKIHLENSWIDFCEISYATWHGYYPIGGQPKLVIFNSLQSLIPKTTDGRNCTMLPVLATLNIRKKCVSVASNFIFGKK
jgi:hypothetical protein